MNLDFQADETQEFENCALCGNLTNVRKDTPIERRFFYVEGAGQLDPGCYRKVYSEDIKRREEIRVRHELYEIGIILD